MSGKRNKVLRHVARMLADDGPWAQYEPRQQRIGNRGFKRYPQLLTNPGVRDGGPFPTVLYSYVDITTGKLIETDFVLTAGLELRLKPGCGKKIYNDLKRASTTQNQRRLARLLPETRDALQELWSERA